MSTLTPTPVVLQDLLTAGADINLFNDGVKAQAVSPRTKGWEPITVQVLDDPTQPAVSSGVANANVVNSLVDTTVNFVTLGMEVGDSVINTADQNAAAVTAITTTTNPNDTLVLGTNDIFPLGTEAYKAIKVSLWTQKDGTGEWTKNVRKTGNNKRFTYPLPTPGTASSVLVNTVVVPVAAPEDTGNYPPATNY